MCIQPRIAHLDQQLRLFCNLSFAPVPPRVDRVLGATGLARLELPESVGQGDRPLAGLTGTLVVSSSGISEDGMDDPLVELRHQTVSTRVLLRQAANRTLFGSRGALKVGYYVGVGGGPIGERALAITMTRHWVSEVDVGGRKERVYERRVAIIGGQEA